MKRTKIIQVQFEVLPNGGGFETIIKQSLRTFYPVIPISSTRVVLEQHRGNEPAFCERGSLTVAGPEVHAPACDHQLAAGRQPGVSLKRQFRRRAARPQLRLRGRERFPRLAL
jgi:hypothetical protein